MRRALASLLAFLMALEPSSLLAQQAAAAPAPQPPPAASQAAPAIDALGVSFQRIKRELGERAPSTNATPLKLEYYVEVIGRAPDMEFFTRQDLAPGPVPGAPPTHWDMVAHVTKPEFKGQSVPISSLAIMGIVKLVQWETNRMKRQRAEEALRLRKEELRKKYPELVVQEKK